jgi:DNA-binding response OmpR family regulator
MGGAEAVAESGTPARDTSRGTPCIGVVARSVATEKAISQALNHAGFTIVSASHDGENRFKPLEHQRLHLVIVEDSPAGITVALGDLRKLLAGKRAPIIAVVDDETVGKLAIDHGANEFILKPVAMDELLKITRRLTERSRQNGSAQARSKTSGLLIASDNVSQLISIGSALQKQGGYKVRLGLGSEDAVAQAKEHKPDAVLIELPLGNGGMVDLCRSLGALRPEPLLMLIASEEEHRTAATLISRPRVVEVIPKPLQLLELPAKVRHVTGIASESSSIDAASLLREEILRVMRAGFARKA